MPRPRASFDVSGRILGPVQQDDDTDIELRIAETNGVAGHLNFIRLTCNNRSSSEWGAGSFIAESGTNRIGANTTLVYVRHYTCPTSTTSMATIIRSRHLLSIPIGQAVET